MRDSINREQRARRRRRLRLTLPFHRTQHTNTTHVPLFRRQSHTSSVALDTKLEAAAPRSGAVAEVEGIIKQRSCKVKIPSTPHHRNKHTANRMLISKIHVSEFSFLHFCSSANGFHSVCLCACDKSRDVHKNSVNKPQEYERDRHQRTSTTIV